MAPPSLPAPRQPFPFIIPRSRVVALMLLAPLFAVAAGIWSFVGIWFLMRMSTLR